MCIHSENGRSEREAKQAHHHRREQALPAAAEKEIRQKHQQKRLHAHGHAKVESGSRAAPVPRRQPHPRNEKHQEKRTMDTKYRRGGACESENANESELPLRL